MQARLCLKRRAADKPASQYGVQKRGLLRFERYEVALAAAGKHFRFRN